VQEQRDQARNLAVRLEQTLAAIDAALLDIDELR
jgi:hypothetical protein